MITVIVESPYAADTPSGIARNLDYLRDCAMDCLHRGEAPFASHALYTQWLDDSMPGERRLGIEAGLAIGARLEKTVVYTDLGITPGMRQGIDRAERESRPIEYRNLPNWRAAA